MNNTIGGVGRAGRESGTVERPGCGDDVASPEGRAPERRERLRPASPGMPDRFDRRSPHHRFVWPRWMPPRSARRTCSGGLERSRWRRGSRCGRRCRSKCTACSPPGRPRFRASHRRLGTRRPPDTGSVLSRCRWAAPGKRRCPDTRRPGRFPSR
jgi:hypothetical protein